MSVKPLYAFGHGLSYTQFDYRDLNLSKTEASAADVITVSVCIQNVGDCAGEEVVQLYVADPVATVTRPVKTLKGFKRISLDAGASTTVKFDLDVRHLAFYNQKMEYIVERGEIQVMLGSASDDIRLTESFEITSTSKDIEQVYLTPATVD
jgi:beta-glucosidase